MTPAWSAAPGQRWPTVKGETLYMTCEQCQTFHKACIETLDHMIKTAAFCRDHETDGPTSESYDRLIETARVVRTATEDLTRTTEVWAMHRWHAHHEVPYDV